MKKYIQIGIILSLGALTLSSCGDKPTLKLENNEDSLSYAQGLIFGTNYNQSVKGNKEAFIAAFNQAFNDDSTQYLMTKEEAFNIINEHNHSIQEAQKEKEEQVKREQRAMNKVKSDKFIEEFKNISGVIPMENGIYYKILKEGFGMKPTLKDTVEINFEGKLFDGTVFSNTFKKNNVCKEALDRSIPGLKQALTEMPVGSTWEIVIPSNLAYGEEGLKNIIPGNAAIKYTIEMRNVIRARKR